MLSRRFPQISGERVDLWIGGFVEVGIARSLRSRTTVDRFIPQPSIARLLSLFMNSLLYLGGDLYLHIDVDLPDPERKAYQLGGRCAGAMSSFSRDWDCARWGLWSSILPQVRCRHVERDCATHLAAHSMVGTGNVAVEVGIEAWQATCWAPSLPQAPYPFLTAMCSTAALGVAERRGRFLKNRCAMTPWPIRMHLT